jgi:hypothetical protein
LGLASSLQIARVNGALVGDHHEKGTKPIFIYFFETGLLSSFKILAYFALGRKLSQF